MTTIPLVFGGASIMTGGAFSTPAAINALFDVLEEVGITTIDGAQMYGDCESLLGQSSVSARPFIIDSKSPGGWIPGSLEPSKLHRDAHQTLSRIGVMKLNTFYIHGPDPNYSLKQTLETVDSLHREGIFSRFGLSNFLAAEVEHIHSLCSQKGWVKPSIYQGNYSAFARRQELMLFPTLRKLGIAFYAYSPLAGGFLARRSAAELTCTKTGGRFVPDSENPEGKKGGLGLYRKLYSEKPKLVKALERWAEIAREAGCECPAELAYRWVACNSGLKEKNGDKVTIGASNVDQVRKTVEWVGKGPLGKEICEAVDALWLEIEEEAPLDNLNL